MIIRRTMEVGNYITANNSGSECNIKSENNITNINNNHNKIFNNRNKNVV